MRSSNGEPSRSPGRLRRPLPWGTPENDPRLDRLHHEGVMTAIPGLSPEQMNGVLECLRKHKVCDKQNNY